MSYLLLDLNAQHLSGTQKQNIKKKKKILKQVSTHPYTSQKSWLFGGHRNYRSTLPWNNFFSWLPTLDSVGRILATSASRLPSLRGVIVTKNIFTP